MRAIITSDLHLTDRPADEYRWRIFGQLLELSKKHALDELWILGDITEFKDYHSSRLVNRFVDTLHWTRKMSRLNFVHIVKGNHDGLDPNTPYFGFVGKLGWCHFHKEPTVLDSGRDRIAVLPHSRTLEEDWARLDVADATHIFLHATFDGARAETGAKLRGHDPRMFDRTKAVILSGDIHVPQKVGSVLYCGAPYPIRHRDSFRPRSVVVIGRTLTFEHLRNIRKLVVEFGPEVSKNPPELNPGDQVKALIKLRDSELGDWQEWKQLAQQYCKEQSAVLSMVQLSKIGHKLKPKIRTGESRTQTPAEALRAYCARNKVEKPLATIGAQLLEEE